MTAASKAQEIIEYFTNYTGPVGGIEPYIRQIDILGSMFDDDYIMDKLAEAREGFQNILDNDEEDEEAYQDSLNLLEEVRLALMEEGL